MTIWQDYQTFMAGHPEALIDQVPPKLLPPMDLDGPASVLYGECVYLLKNEVSGLLKIGYSTRLIGRRLEIAKQVSVWPKQLSVLASMCGGKALEAELHERFSHRRAVLEWFVDCPEIRAEFGP